MKKILFHERECFCMFEYMPHIKYSGICTVQLLVHDFMLVGLHLFQRWFS